MTDMKKELPTRSEIPVEDTWDLTTIFETDEQWEAEFQQLNEEGPKIKKFQGSLGESADQLYALFEFQDRISERLGKLYTYSHMRYDEDTTNATYQAMNQKAESILTLRSEEHTSELQSRGHLVCRLLLDIKSGRESGLPVISPLQPGHYDIHPAVGTGYLRRTKFGSLFDNYAHPCSYDQFHLDRVF